MIKDKLILAVLTILGLIISGCGSTEEPVPIVSPISAQPETVCINFDFYPDNAHPGQVFEIYGFKFSSLGTLDPIVNDVSPNVHGLQVDPVGLQIDFPVPASKIELIAGSYTTESLVVIANDEYGNVIDQVVIPGDSNVHTITISEAGIFSAIITGGEFEGVLVEICIETDADLDPLSCIEFEDLTLGAKFHVVDVFISSGIPILGSPFIWSDGTQTDTGFAEVNNAQDAGGSGQDLEVNNILLEFDYGRPLNALKGRFGEYGGNLNLIINGQFRNFENFSDIDGAVIDGVSVSVLFGSGNDQGEILLEGEIYSCAIGGQELFIDSICPRE